MHVCLLSSRNSRVLFVDLLANVHIAVTHLIRYVPSQVLSNDKEMVGHIIHVRFFTTFAIDFKYVCSRPACRQNEPLKDTP